MSSDGRYSWRFVGVGEPLERIEEAARPPSQGEVVVEVAGCGVCHTDLGFLDGSVATKQPLPIVLGHEISGRVVQAGSGSEDWLDKAVLIPAVIPCDACDLCRAGKGNACINQKMPGNDLDGGWATHITVPTNGLSVIENLPDRYELADLSVIADAVTTPLQAVRRAGVTDGDFVVIVGVGGVGSYAVQIAAASGGTVVAVDIDDERLDQLKDYGAAATVNSRGMSPRDVRDAVREHAKAFGKPATGWKIFECSGTAPGQETAYGMLGPQATLAVVGFTMDKISIRLSNLMAFDATAFGTWGCPPQLYPEAIELVTSGKVDLAPFIRKVPMTDIAQALDDAHNRVDPRRTILIP
ncbi:MAG: 6-hydroxycyclohex-1-ene-1-carbonyl-CoA dehydrogenase [Armatimonadetes bacterium]|nr:MAG: 6-hydroxycyclohex-1-ene-1-carbonyl-CoA dehydrogenase [Armatimonadota bacterium]